MPHIKGHLTIKFDLASSFISLTGHLFSTTFVFILNNLVYNWNWLEGTHTINSRCQRFIWIRILSSIKTVRSAVYLEILLILAYTCNANMLAQYAVHLPNRQWIVRPIHFYINYLILFFYFFFYIYNFVLYFFYSFQTEVGWIGFYATMAGCLGSLFIARFVLLNICARTA